MTVTIQVDKMSFEELTERKERLEKSALRAIDLEKNNLFETAATKLDAVYARIDELKKED